MAGHFCCLALALAPASLAPASPAPALAPFGRTPLPAVAPAAAPSDATAPPSPGHPDTVDGSVSPSMAAAAAKTAVALRGWPRRSLSPTDPGVRTGAGSGAGVSSEVGLSPLLPPSVRRRLSLARSRRLISASAPALAPPLAPALTPAAATTVGLPAPG